MAYTHISLKQEKYQRSGRFFVLLLRHMDSVFWCENVVIATCELTKRSEAKKKNCWNYYHEPLVFNSLLLESSSFIILNFYARWEKKKHGDGESFTIEIFTFPTDSLHVFFILCFFFLLACLPFAWQLMKLTYLWTRVESYYIHIKCFNCTTRFIVVAATEMLENNWIWQFFVSPLASFTCLHKTLIHSFAHEKWLKFHFDAVAFAYGFCVNIKNHFPYMYFAQQRPLPAPAIRTASPQTEFAIKSTENALITKIKHALLCNKTANIVKHMYDRVTVNQPTFSYTSRVVCIQRQSIRFIKIVWQKSEQMTFHSHIIANFHL